MLTFFGEVFSTIWLVQVNVCSYMKITTSSQSWHILLIHIENLPKSDFLHRTGHKSAHYKCNLGDDTATYKQEPEKMKY